MDKFVEVIGWCRMLNIKELSVFALSAENLKRTQIEVDTLMELARHFFGKMIKEQNVLKKHDIKIKVIGNIKPLPKDIIESIQKVE